MFLDSRFEIGNREKGSFVIQLRDWKIVAGLLETRERMVLLSWFLFNQLTWNIIFIIIVTKLASKLSWMEEEIIYSSDRILYFVKNKILIFWKEIIKNKKKEYKRDKVSVIEKANFLNIPSMCSLQINL